MAKYEYPKQLNMHHYEKKKSIKTKGLENNLLHEHTLFLRGCFRVQKILFNSL